LAATNGATVSISKRTSPSITTHQVRVSGCRARGVFVPGLAEMYSLRRCSSSTISSRQSLLPECFTLRSASLVWGLCGGRYCAGFSFGAHSPCAPAHTGNTTSHRARRIALDIVRDLLEERQRMLARDPVLERREPSRRS